MTEQVVKDYVTMTDEQLNREVAERVGYKVRSLGPYGWAIEFNDGYTNTSETLAEVENLLPDYTFDLNAAIKLWDTIPDDYIPRLVRSLTPKDGVMTFEYKAHIMANDLSSQVEHYATTPARAVCLCWLAWKDAQS